MRETTSFLLEDAINARENRNKYFQKGLAYLQNNSIMGIINEKKMRFHWNINFYIDMFGKCNANCQFCINRVNFTRDDISDTEFIRKLDHAIKKTRFLDPSIQIVGGEPTIRPERLFAIIDLIKKYGLRKPIIGTNGSGIIDYDILDYVEPVIDHLNISRHHFIDFESDRLMGFSNPLDNSRLIGIMNKHPVAKKIRLNCCLLKNYIDSYEKIIEYIDWALGIGIKNICFSTLSKLPENYIYQKDFIKQSEYYAIDFGGIMDAVKENSHFDFIKFHTGSHCMYEVWNYNHAGTSCPIVFATSDNNYARMLDNLDDLIELLVFHSDGTLAGSWNKNCKILYIDSSST
ncbi:MAG: radical SAM protein [Spirochaetales bacterium]|nr:radical SAM protein [Spirochaetales bacterium]